MNNPFHYTPDDACMREFKKLLASLELLKLSESEEDKAVLREIESGKMLGVLIAEDKQGQRHTLYAFSGQLGNGGFNFRGFVEPVFDYLQPYGYFKTNERKISAQNREIADFETKVVAARKAEFEQAKVHNASILAEYKDKFSANKQERNARRMAGICDTEELESMIRQSQFEKAELHRVKKKLSLELTHYQDNLERAQAELAEMKAKRRRDSEQLQSWLFNNHVVMNGRGQTKSISDIFAETPLQIPPSGAGECCAPKLLQAAYRRGWHPVSMAEYWYGKPKGGELRIHGSHYPACSGKCLPVLTWMLQGVDVKPPLAAERQVEVRRDPRIIYENQWFCVVDKPEGMLSVPGKGHAMSLETWLTDRYGAESEVRPVHRLDQDTSGLVIATFGQQAYKTMQSLFARRLVKKSYVAELQGSYIGQQHPAKGRISLPLLPDYLDRPRQRVDYEKGKEALTDFEFISVEEDRSRVIFHPLTGRTHQLRVHAASSEGLGMPIVGDVLYAKDRGAGERRLKLHAQELEFISPFDGQTYRFTAPVPF
ncbi:MAG: RluA family pseudouridine synthase [Muribaculaceae bacterium]|nr:RluA family pseudouridine synthase [Muribaculaceae bacterium]